MSEFRNAVWANTRATARFVRSCHKKHMTQGQTCDHPSGQSTFGSGHKTRVFFFLVYGTKVHFKLSAVTIYDPVTVVLSRSAGWLLTPSVPRHKAMKSSRSVSP